MGIINNLNNAMYTMHDNFQAKFNNMVHTGNNANATKQVQETQSEETQTAAADSVTLSSAEEHVDNAAASGVMSDIAKGLNETDEESETSETKTGETKVGNGTGETDEGTGKVDNGTPKTSEDEDGAINDGNADTKIDNNRKRADEIKNGKGDGGNGGNDGNDKKVGGEKRTPYITAEEAQKAAERQKEMDQVRNILVQMAADRRKWLAELIKTIRETNDKIFEIIQSSILNRASVFNNVNKAWSDVIRGR